MIRPLNEAEDWPGTYPDPLPPTKTEPYWVPGIGWCPKDESDWPDCEPPKIEEPEWLKNLPDALNHRRSYKLAA